MHWGGDDDVRCRADNINILGTIAEKASFTENKENAEEGGGGGGGILIGSILPCLSKKRSEKRRENTV